MSKAGILRELPPLILYPFDRRSDADDRLQPDGFEALPNRYLESRYAEFRQLCLIGKDLNRWLVQCVETVAGDPEMDGMSECDFIAVLLFSPPPTVIRKMRLWGVKNFQVIFSRALGLNAVFPHPPSAGAVTESFLRDFHKYADALHDARLRAEDPAPARENAFTFEIFASGEYSAYLEKSWAD